MTLRVVGCGLALLAALTACTSDATTDEVAGATDEPVTTTLTDSADVDDEVPDTSDSATNDSAVPDSSPMVTHGEVRTQEDDGGIEPEGFTTITARVISAEGEVCDVCLWLADDSNKRSRGLMGVNDLGDAVGMAFVFDQPTSGNFFMLGTPTPLSIAWFAPDGSHVAETDMEPCITDDSSTCERYGPGGDYTVAVEMFQGELGVIGIGPGSSIELLDGTESPTCLVTT